MAGCLNAADFNSPLGLGRLANDLELSALHVDPDVDKRRNRFVRYTFIGYQHVYVVDRRNQGSTYSSDLSMIGDDDLLACLTHHGAVNRGLVRIVCGDAMFDVDAIDADEYLINKDFTDAFDGL